MTDKRIKNSLWNSELDIEKRLDFLMNSSLNPPFEMGDQAKPKRCLEY